MRSAAKTQPVFVNHIPDPLQILILEYLSLEDLYSVGLCNQKLYSLIQSNSSLWARHLFKKFLNPLLRDQDCFFDEQEFSVSTSTQEQDSIFQQMPKPKAILQEHYAIKLEWTKFLGSSSLTESQRLINDVFQHIKVPQTPFPCLKRDIHHFPTNTMFQNFLTEVYFQVHMGGVRDRNSLIVEDLLEKIQQESCEQLLEMRPENVFDRSCRQTAKKSLEKDSIILRDRLKINHKIRYQGSPKAQKNRKRKISKRSSQYKSRKTIQSGLNGAEKFLELVYSLIDNYCGMVWSYLSGIKEPCFLLREYTRLWKDFAMLLIEYNQIFYPLSKSMNTSSSSECKQFSIWNMMVEIWTNKVYSYLVDSLIESFCNLLNNYRCIPQTSKSNFSYQDNIDIQNDAACLVNDQNDDTQITHVLKEFYQAVCDLSLNENTVFFWDCMTSNSKSPKGQLDLRILEGAQFYYNAYQTLENCNSAMMKLVFEEDARLLESLFGNELGTLILELQFSCLEISLSTFFESTLEQAKVELPLNLYYINKMESLNMGRGFGALTIYKGCERELMNNLELQNAFYCVALKNLPSIEEYFRLMSYLTEKIKVQTEKRDRKNNKLFRAGFDPKKEHDNKRPELGTHRKINRIKTRCDRSNFVSLSETIQIASAARI